MQIKSTSISLAKIFEWYNLWCTRPLFRECSFPCCPIDVLMCSCHLLTFWTRAWPCLDLISKALTDIICSMTLYVFIYAQVSFTPLAPLPFTRSRACLGYPLVQRGSGADLNMTYLLESRWAKCSLNGSNFSQHRDMWARHSFTVVKYATALRVVWCATWHHRCKS